VAFLKSLLEDSIKIQGERIWVMQGDQGTDPVNSLSSALPE
jgi:hypothetical protein